MPYLISFRAQIVGLVLCISGLNLSATPKIDLIELYHGVAEGNYLIGDLGGAEPLLWRSRVSFIRYLRLTVLEAGGFPGCMGIAAYEPLRAALTEGLVPF